MKKRKQLFFSTLNKFVVETVTTDRCYQKHTCRCQIFSPIQFVNQSFIKNKEEEQNR